MGSITRGAKTVGKGITQGAQWAKRNKDLIRSVADVAGYGKQFGEHEDALDIGIEAVTGNHAAAFDRIVDRIDTKYGGSSNPKYGRMVERIAAEARSMRIDHEAAKGRGGQAAGAMGPAMGMAVGRSRSMVERIGAQSHRELTHQMALEETPQSARHLLEGGQSSHRVQNDQGFRSRSHNAKPQWAHGGGKRPNGPPEHPEARRRRGIQRIGGDAGRPPPRNEGSTTPHSGGSAINQKVNEARATHAFNF